MAIICIVFLVAQWRSHDIAARHAAAVAEKEQKVRLQILERERKENAERQARAARLQQEEAARLRAISARREDTQRAQAAASDEESRRTELWQKFYRPAPGCDRSATVECANGFMRAHRKFEELYAKHVP